MSEVRELEYRWKIRKGESYSIITSAWQTRVVRIYAVESDLLVVRIGLLR
jgi:hypothetical protein